MNEFLEKVSTQIFDFFKGLSVGKKIGLIGAGTGMVAALVAIFYWAGDRTFKSMMTNLNPEDAANIIRVLREKRIPFLLDESGRNISVPPEQLHQLRLELATMGYPQSSTVGYEVFDKQTLGTTTFVQKLNQKRALEGELMRTIGTIKGVRRARVHLATPQKTAFVEDQKKSTASVVVDLEPGTQLGDKQVYGIGNLVARAVEGMDMTDVVIVDSNGKTLSKNGGDALSAASTTQLDFRQKVEQDMEKRVEEMLARVVGEGRVVARVTAELDFSQVNETQTMYDADGTAVRSTQKDLKSAEGSRPGPTGPPGAPSNTPGEGVVAGQRPGVRNDSKSSNEVVTYEVPQTVRRTTKASGAVKKISVAVVVDGKTIKSVDAEGKTLTKVEAWSPEKLKEFESVVVSALGIDRKRGDTLEIRNMEFAREDFEEANRQIAESERRAYLQNMLSYAVIGLVIVLFFMFVVRPFIKWVTENTIDSVDSFLPQTIEELEKLQRGATLPGLEEVVPVLPERLDPEKVEGEMIKEKIITLVEANPQKAALILKEWLHGSGHRRVEDKDSGKNKTA